MKRQIIKIDENKCTGCGLCVPNCPEGALKVIDGKARLVGELLCDGLGACIGNCPEGAILIEERDAEAYDEKKVMGNIVRSGPAVLAAHLKHLKEHDQDDYLKIAEEYMKDNNIEEPEVNISDKPMACGCPGTMMRDFRKEDSPAKAQSSTGAVQSELRQWPTQLHLVNPHAPYFADADLLVAADCTAFAFGDFHRRFLKGKALVMFCPKLDTTMDMYVEKLTAIIRDNNIKSITVAKMEVPCCYGALSLTEQALKASGKNIVLKEYTVGIQGGIV
ncbi:MAG: 4Fe-4S ferredoxin [Omnitrophica WOR_2 bacterium GWF2_38_59]|nr:MAG: 4Fe-4S ferredoxin [Omnitrophica WOR_2 bacterium GWA2_37_7]OGX25505.1 MAG: 4Fe-4S ferredoxin [Omnitrophica WOR_2 bacterium GWF2_38_59]OGX48103.1 MAG: 4Fe-4S ferredoxin [Omnitrophica WOR_2 bacterium RIFOXYA2_FULL_38_17]OGX54289.1 MAG: 4Fe-4S ferredoxin [Omnitrophica WOR_2 bacterium RIFOXYA12_FULL_38_10]OGX56793.1 MAG: 4Fe-4S ferredoxin [Omnitrophica WOR_2 bacterium RIFOXYC2_FULL_38_12]OGX58439.1 MAG: 4Fe-4S ferredoxin [Omnitrophica WOR_2 bacterium RIFOXYB2_FULL_38_16]HBG62502.1 4Fe-4S f